MFSDDTTTNAIDSTTGQMTTKITQGLFHLCRIYLEQTTILFSTLIDRDHSSSELNHGTDEHTIG